MDWSPPDGLKYLTDNPVGVKHRAADIEFAKQHTGWSPSFTLEQGLRETVRWYCSTHNPDEVKDNLETLLTER